MLGVTIAALDKDSGLQCVPVELSILRELGRQNDGDDPRR